MKILYGENTQRGRYFGTTLLVKILCENLAKVRRRIQREPSPPSQGSERSSCDDVVAILADILYGLDAQVLLIGIALRMRDVAIHAMRRV